MVLRGILLLLLVNFACPGRAQQTRWSTQFGLVSVFSSPQATDLNGDNILDIVIGAGAENAVLPKGVIALDGLDGSELWSYPARSQVFGTALFQDISGDGVNDVFIGGREAIFYALDGTTGIPIWEFWPDSLSDPAQAGWYQFYNPQWIADQDQDGVRDLLVSNGGDATALAYDSLRPSGQLVVLSGLTGQVIARANLPDQHETYFSPLLLDQSANPDILFGSGGETVRGKLWRAPLADLLANDLSNAQLLLSDTLKGFIPVSGLTDLNGDAVDDIIQPALNGGLVALDGSTNQTLWRLDFPGYENYVSPTLGQFTGDPTPDAFGILAKGQWSFYAEFVKYLVDGATGQIVWTDTTSIYQMTQPNALDWDGDGFDEILLLHNYDIGNTVVTFQNRLRIYDFQSGLITDFGGPRSGLNLFSTPLIIDLDGDASLEIILAHHDEDDQWNGLTGARIESVALNRSVPQMAWSGYMGNDRDGRYQSPSSTSQEESFAIKAVNFVPNPTTGRVNIIGGWVDQLEVYDLNGRKVGNFRKVREFDLTELARGVYIARGYIGKEYFSEKIILY